jgi:hypothetical protein
MSHEMSDRADRAYAEIVRHMMEHGRPPTLKHLSDFLGYTSRMGSWNVLNRLALEGRVRLVPTGDGGRHRTIEIPGVRWVPITAHGLRRRTIAVKCPACGAPNGMPCTGKKGQPIAGWHVDRSDEAKRAGLVSP